MEQVFLVVDYDHRWTWSPDGTESTGAYTGWTSGTMNFLLENDKYGNLSADTNTFSFKQAGIIQGNPGQCEVDGSGRAEITLSGICQNGLIELEWMEVATGESEATMTCDKEEFNSLTYCPLQVVMGFELSDEGLGYKSATDTTMPFFRDVHMRWEIRMVPQGQLD